MSNNPTVEDVERMKKEMEQKELENQNQPQQKQQMITVDGNPQEANPPANVSNVRNDGGGDTNVGNGKVSKVTLESEFVKIEITDPNVLDELNTEGKYAQNVPFKALEININNNGGRIRAVAEDKKEVDREILSGISRKEMQNIKTFKLQR